MISTQYTVHNMQYTIHGTQYAVHMSTSSYSIMQNNKSVSLSLITLTSIYTFQTLGEYYLTARVLAIQMKYSEYYITAL